MFDVIEKNIVDPDQLACASAQWSGSTLFSKEGIELTRILKKPCALIK